MESHSFESEEQKVIFWQQARLVKYYLNEHKDSVMPTPCSSVGQLLKEKLGELRHKGVGNVMEVCDCVVGGRQI